MIAYQLSIFAENKPGRLDQIAEVLAAAGLSIRAIKIGDLGEYGLVKILVNDPDKGYNALRNEKFIVSLKPVIAVEVDDKPGALHMALRTLTKNIINVEDAYGFTLCNRGILIIEATDAEKAYIPLKEAGLKLLSEEEIYSL